MPNLTIINWTMLLFSFFLFDSKSNKSPTVSELEKNPPSYSLLLHDYKINDNGHIKLFQRTNDNFDRLILIEGKKGKIHYNPTKGSILNPYIKVKKDVLGGIMHLEGQANGQHYKGIKLNFREDFDAAKTLFDFLADHTSIEWSLLSFGINKQTRSFLYTSYRSNLEYFGSVKVHHILNYPETVDSLKHYHNHPRMLNEALGKYAFPSNSDLEFRNKVLAKNFSIVEFLIRTDGFYIDYTDPQQWNKTNGEDWM